MCVFTSAGQRIQNKSFCVYNTYVHYYVYLKKDTYSIYFENIYMYLHAYNSYYI